MPLHVGAEEVGLFSQFSFPVAAFVVCLAQIHGLWVLFHNFLVFCMGCLSFLLLFIA